MNILFIYTNINAYHSDYYSFGLASIISVTKASGHTARLSIVNSFNDYRMVLREIDEFNPQVIGFTSVSSQFMFVNKLAAKIKEKYKDTIIVCGGTHPTINPDCLLESRDIDGIFIGEAENSFIEFLQKIESGDDFKTTDNFGYVENNKLITNKLKPLVSDIASLPYPDKTTYPYAKVIRKTFYAPFLFLRGCPCNCAYCSNHAIAKKYSLMAFFPRYRNPESSIREIEEAFKLSRIKFIRIVDEIFGIDAKWREEFCNSYKKRIKVKFHCFTRPDIVTPDYIKLLKDSGCHSISIGIESGNEHIRNFIMKRKISDKQIINAFDLAHKYGLKTSAINMIGLPQESEEMVWDTIKLNRRVKPTISGVNIFYPYKGTELGEYCFKNGLVDTEAYSKFSNERRESILLFSKEYRDKLIYYKNRWRAFVYPDNLLFASDRIIRDSFIGNQLRKLKHSILRWSKVSS
ncbi:MAG: radical SAM protein [Candidatus Omnitrophota bacterium]|jgi:radical SAM superfamily enzyme YgiQ (UPF0313 family)|nr:MAG: radical SAM protein [Candidatus Omnitrophota bacterium]